MHKQRGFIQNFIIPGIILIGVVIAGIAMLASNSGGSDTTNEKASMLANSLIGSGLTVASAIQRAEADGTEILSGGLDSTSPLVAGKYLTALPSLPQGLSAYGDAVAYSKGQWEVTANSVDIGSAEKDDVLLLSLGTGDLARSVCNRINNKIAGVASNDDGFQASLGAGMIASNADVAGVTEGCAFSGISNSYYYYKVVNSK